MELLLEAELDDPNVHYLALIEEAMADKDFAKTLANWFVNLEIPLRHEDANADTPAANVLTNQARLHIYRQTYELAKGGKLSSTNAKELITRYLVDEVTLGTVSQAAMARIVKAGDADEANEETVSVEAFAKQHNLIQESNEGEIAKIVAEVLANNPKAADDVRNGELKAIGFLVGQVMKASQGKANPGLAGTLIKRQLGLAES
jgi:Asp-tRNA(Asn)/Glu-tRNA(Gln) amidotransferase B subunit